MAERDRFRSDERWGRDDDWRREGSSWRGGDESRRNFGEGSEDYYRSRDFGSRGEFGRGDFGRSDYGRSEFGQGRGEFGRDYGRGRDFGGGSYGDQSFGDYGRDFGRGEWGRSGDWGRSGSWNRSGDWNRPQSERWSGGESWRDQRGSYGGLGYGGSSQGFGRYGEGFGPYGRDFGSRSSFGSSDYGRGYGSDYGRGDSQRGREDDRGFIERATDAVSSWFGGGEGQQHHRGRGPKGYARSDDRIREDVSDRLGDDWLVDASEIEVMVLNGEVTLSGSVNSRDQRRRAEDIAESVSGVKHVQNNVRVSDMSAAGFGSTPGTTTSTGSTGSTSTSRKTGTSS